MSFALRVIIISICVSYGYGQVPLPSRIPIEFEGNRVFLASDLRAVTQKCLDTDPSWNETQNQQTLDYCLGRLKFFLHSRGYLQATISKRQKDEANNQSGIVIHIEEGLPFRLGKIDVQGPKILSPTAILEMLEVKPGDVADGERLSAWLFERVKKVYDRLGYIQYGAELDPTFEVQTNSSEGVVNAKVTIDEGNQFRLRSMNFIGNQASLRETLLKEMLVHKGDVFNKELFEDSLKRINETGLVENIDSSKDVDYKVQQETSLVDVTVHLRKQTDRRKM